MEAQENAHTPDRFVPEGSSSHNTVPPRMPVAAKFAMATTLVLLLGIGVIVSCIVLLTVLDSYQAQIEDPCVLVMYGGLFLACFAAPLLGSCAVLSALRNWGATAVVAGTLARRFLVAAAIFGVAIAVIAVLAFTLDDGWTVPTIPDWVLAWYAAVAVVAVAMGTVAFRLSAADKYRRFVRTTAACTVLLALASAVVAIREVNVVAFFFQRAQYTRRTETFSGESDELKDTVIVPTLDTPCPAGRNVIWCSSFQLAWNRMKEDVFEGRVDVVGAEDVAARLNVARQSAADLEANSYYAAAGRTDEGTVDRIATDMAARFPSHTLPDLTEFEGPGGLVMYSFLTANVAFEYPFRQAESGFFFTDSQGDETAVDGFGLWEAYQPEFENMREQLEILYASCSDPNDPYSEMTGFALDLCKHSEPYQVVVARVGLRESLAATVEHVRRQMEDFQRGDDYEQARLFDDVDILFVPEMFWEIDHRFDELIGKMVASVGMPIVEARQTIRFRLDRSGAMLESESWGAVSAIPRYFLFNQPFLIYMQKRRAAEPFFVMWVDNAELLRRR